MMNREGESESNVGEKVEEKESGCGRKNGDRREKKRKKSMQCSSWRLGRCKWLEYY